MSRKEIGFWALVNAIGEDFCRQHNDDAVFSHGETDKGLFCFLGIDLHPWLREVTLSAPMSDWDIYASCYVLENNEVVMDECRLPEQH